MILPKYAVNLPEAFVLKHVENVFKKTPKLKKNNKDLNLYLSCAMFIGNSQKGARYLSSYVYHCHIDQTVRK